MIDTAYEQILAACVVMSFACVYLSIQSIFYQRRNPEDRPLRSWHDTEDSN